MKWFLLIAILFSHGAFAQMSDYNSANVGMLKAIPAGTFTKGTEKISVNAFHIGVTEVTGAQYKTVMGTIPSDPNHVWFGATLDNAPVGNVNVYDIFIYCNKLSIMEGLTPVYSIAGTTDPTKWIYPTTVESRKPWDEVTANPEANGYRLPTEPEWDWAAMGATDTFAKEFAGDPNPTKTGDDAWKWGWTHPRSSLKTRKVCTKLPNELGLCDMVGNITEYVFTRHPQFSYGYMVKGGSVNSIQSTSTIAFQRPADQSLKCWYNGFRLARK